jgi:hypothetical protein
VAGLRRGLAKRLPKQDFQRLEPLLAAYQDVLEKGEEGQKFFRPLFAEDSDLLSSALKTAEQWIDEALHEFIQAPDVEVGNVIAEMGYLLSLRKSFSPFLSFSFCYE